MVPEQCLTPQDRTSSHLPSWQRIVGVHPKPVNLVVDPSIVQHYSGIAQLVCTLTTTRAVTAVGQVV